MTEIRREILSVLEELSAEHPAMRFGQLVLFVAHSARGPKVSATYDVEDTEFLAAARRHLERRRQERLTAEADEPAARAA